VDKDTAGCVDSDGNIISQPATAQPGQNGQEGQGVDAADRGPAVDQGRPGRPIKDCGNGPGCVTYPNTVKRKFVGGESHFDFDFDWTGSAPPDDGKASLGTGSGPLSLRVTLDQAKALDGARIVATMLSGATGAVKTALGRVTQTLSSRASGALSSAIGRFAGKLGALSRAQQAATGGGSKALEGFSSIVTRTTRGGGQGVKLTRPDGSVLDITAKRVKEFVPNTHPNAPAGALQRVKFPNAQPGTKGFKRDPTADELRLLEETFK
jgi:hypothetical protein